MKRLGLFLFALLASSVVHAKYYYVIAGTMAVADNFHYSSPDDACEVMYSEMESKLAGWGYTLPSPYTAPILDYEYLNTAQYTCSATATTQPDIGDPLTTTVADTIVRKGNNCTDAQVYNPNSGMCEDPNEDQDRKEKGDSDGVAAVIVSKCVGDPINAASGNLFETDIDYEDADGELKAIRYYNSSDGRWIFSFETYLTIDDSALALHFADGRASLFKLEDNVATSEPSEQGRMDQVEGQWVYTSPTNEEYVFDNYGRLITYRQSNGLVQNIVYTLNTDYSTTTTITDSRGHVMTVDVSMYGVVDQLTVGDLTVAYTWDTVPPYVFRLSQVASTRAGHTSTRTYLYGDSRNALWLTGITDERGIVDSSWTYDDQGRATSSQHADGADLTSLAYNSDGTTTVTNALGNSVTFTYQVIQGAKRITHIAGQQTASCPASNASYTYTDDGQVHTVTDALGHVTEYTYDGLGRLVTQVEAQGTPQERTTTTTWNATWPYLRASVTTPDRTTSFGYDDQGRLTSTTVHDNKE